MAISNISLILPLQDAAKNPKNGNAAGDLSQLATARFSIPRGFVISADAYRCHLWATGGRHLAAKAKDENTRSLIKESILSADIPNDIWASVEEAYHKLSLQTGLAEPVVMISPSFTALYPDESIDEALHSIIIKAQGPGQLQNAIKESWASVWSIAEDAEWLDNAGVAVIISQFIEAACKATTFSADPASGNPHIISVSLDLHDSPFYVNLNDFSISGDLIESIDSSQKNAIQLLAEKTVIIQEKLSSHVRVNWIKEGKEFWAVGVRRLLELPKYFPLHWSQSKDFKQLKLAGSSPASFFTCGWLSSSKKYNGPSAQVLNGYIYYDSSDTGWGIRHSLDKELAKGKQLLVQWQNEIEPDLAERINRLASANFEKFDGEKLRTMLYDALCISSSAVKWLENAIYPCKRFPELLQELVLGAGASYEEYQALIKGVSEEIIVRDARLHELAERFAAAEQYGLLEQPGWWSAYRKDVEEFAKEYLYSFRAAIEAYDVSAWKSWAEDAEIVLRMIAALSKCKFQTSIITLHTASLNSADSAARNFSARFSGVVRKHFDMLLSLSRDWLRKRNRCQQICAKAQTLLRLALLEFGRRLKEKNIISSREDIFELLPEEVLNIPLEPEDSFRNFLAEDVAKRKHQKWLQQRLSAPEFIPDVERHADNNSLILEGIPRSSGIAQGRARIIRSDEEISCIENGEVLIVKSPGLAWTPFFAQISGFVAEEDETLLSASVIAREYGIPAVTGCRGAMSKISSGNRVMIDGKRGVVEII